MFVRFLLIGEGSSDHGLVPHLEFLCLANGASEVAGVAPNFGRFGSRVGHDVESKLRLSLQLEPNVDLILIHRDADATDPAPRRAEISRAVDAVGNVPSWIPVVPVQETEAWALLDEPTIRRVAGNPTGRRALGLPTIQEVERIADPKARLKQALIDASETTGRRRRKFVRDFPAHRARILESLLIDGPIQQLNAWQQLRQDIRDALAVLQRIG